MTTIDCVRLRASGALHLEHILEAELQVTTNQHGYACIVGETGGDAFEKLNGAIAGQEMRIWTQEDDGWLRSAAVQRHYRHCHAHCSGRL